MANARLKAEIVSTGIDSFVRETKEMKKGVEDVSKASKECSKAIDNKSNADRRALIEARKHQQEMKRQANEAKKFKKECNELSSTLNNFTSKMGVNIGSLGQFTTKLGAAGVALGVAGGALKKFIDSNDELGDSVTIVKNQITDMFDAMFRVGSNMDGLFEKSKKASIAFDDMQTNVPLIEAELEGITFQYNQEVALARDINLEEGERLKHLAKARELLAKMNRLELDAIEFKQKASKTQFDVGWAKAGGKGTMTTDQIDALKTLWLNGQMDSFLNNTKNKERYNKLTATNDTYFSSNWGTTYIKGAEKALDGADKEFADLFNHMQAFAKMMNDEKLQPLVLSMVNITNEKQRVLAEQAAATADLSKLQKRIVGKESTGKSEAEKEAERLKKKAEEEAKRKEERINTLNTEMSGLQTKKTNASLFGLDTLDIDKDIAVVDEKLKKEGVDGAGVFVDEFKKKLEEELQKINPNFKLDEKLSANDSYELYKGVIDGAKDASEKAKKEAEKNQKDLEEAQKKYKRIIEDGNNAIISLGNTANMTAGALANLFTMDEDASGWDWIEAITSGLSQIISQVPSVIAGIKAIQTAKSAASAQEITEKSAETVASLSKSGANASEALSGAAKSGASLPFPANIAAITAGVAAVMAVIGTIAGAVSKAKKHANGGIVSGSTTVGDRILTRLNAGEMVLNNRQQSNLFKMLNSPYASQGQGVGQVEFKINGSDLVGSIRNYQKKHNVKL